MQIMTLVMVVRGGRVLLGRKKTGAIGKGLLNAPGGKCNPGESPLACAVRETKEELGLMLDPRCLECVSQIISSIGGVPTFFVHVFRTTQVVGVPQETVDMGDPEWYAIDALPTGQMHESDCLWFARAANGERFCARVYYRERSAKGFERIEFAPYPSG